MFVKKILFISVFLVCLDYSYTRRRFTNAYHSCDNDQACAENAFCYGYSADRLGKCKCYDGYAPYRNSTYLECLPESFLGENCTKDFQCRNTAGPQAVCENSICICNNQSHKINNECFNTAKLDEICMEDANCVLSNSSQKALCVNSRCKCEPQYAPSPDKTFCILVRRHLNEQCMSDDDCSDIQNTVCSDVCKCKEGYIISRDGEKCLQAVESFGEPCFEDGQCGKYLERSICRDGFCDCDDGFHIFTHRCLQSTKLEEKCEEDANCIFVEDQPEGITSCVENICKCTYGEEENEYGCKLKADSSAANSIHIFSMYLIFVWVFHIYRNTNAVLGVGGWKVTYN